MRIKICRKEVKESRLWIRLSEPKQDDQQLQERLIEEATELTKIFNAIIERSA